jgi:hypothetical protein
MDDGLINQYGSLKKQNKTKEKNQKLVSTTQP